MTDKWILIDGTDHRELYRWQKQMPDGEWATMFRGKEFVLLQDGSRRQTPADPFFQSEADGRNWLSAV